MARESGKVGIGEHYGNFWYMSDIGNKRFHFNPSG